jgi:hypothetical protein
MSDDKSAKTLSLALLVGNGLNRLSANDGIAWDCLLIEAARTVGPGLEMPHDVHGAGQYPLLYDLLLMRLACSDPTRKDVGTRLQKRIARTLDERAKRMAERDSDAAALVCDELLALKPAHIITPNFDPFIRKRAEKTLSTSYSCEPSSWRLKKGRVKPKPANEPKYSLFRRFVPQSGAAPAIWHMHGSTDEYGSIMLGYEHYCGQVEKLRRYYKPNKRDLDYKSRAPVYQGEAVETLEAWSKQFSEAAPHLKGNASRGFGWPDIFLGTDVWMLGIGMPFTELTLWWLLSLRATLLAGIAQTHHGSTDSFGTVHYVEFDGNGKTEPNEAKREGLEGLGVDFVRVPSAKTYPERWRNAISIIHERRGVRRRAR